MTGPTAATIALVKQRDLDRCALCGWGIIGDRGVDWSVHHRRPRGAGGTNRAWINQPANLVLLHGSGVTKCHGLVEANRGHYYAKGFLIREGIRVATEVPIEHRVHGYVLLDNNGTFEVVA